MIPTLLPELFANRDTTLADIRDAGWFIDHSSSGAWWFTKKGTTEHVFIPRWIYEIERRAEEYGKQCVQDAVKGALGIEGSRP